MPASHLERIYRLTPIFFPFAYLGLKVTIQVAMGRVSPVWFLIADALFICVTFDFWCLAVCVPEGKQIAGGGRKPIPSAEQPGYEYARLQALFGVLLLLLHMAAFVFWVRAGLWAEEPGHGWDQLAWYYKAGLLALVPTSLVVPAFMLSRDPA